MFSNKIFLFAGLMFSGFFLIFLSTRTTISWNCPQPQESVLEHQKTITVVERKHGGQPIIESPAPVDNSTVVLLNEMIVPASVVWMEERNVRLDLRRGLWGAEVDAFGKPSFLLHLFIPFFSCCWSTSTSSRNTIGYLMT